MSTAKGLSKHRDGLPVGWVGMRYPAGDPENGPAYRQRWTGEGWECAACSPVLDDGEEGTGRLVCVTCNRPM